MVLSIVEPVFAGLLVSLLNRYVLSGQCCGWFQQTCDDLDENTEEEEQTEHDEDSMGVSSTTTTFSDATVHMHYYT